MQADANAGGLLCTYLNGKHLLISDETAQLALQYVLIISRRTSVSKWSEKLFRSVSSHINPVATTKMVVWLSLLPLPPKHAMCSNSLGVPELQDTSVIWWLPPHEYIHFFFSLCELRHAAQQPWGPWGLGIGRYLDLLHWMVMSFWISYYKTHIISRVPKAPYCATTQ